MTAPKWSIPTNMGRWYCRPGSTKPEVPSVTNIKDMMDKAWLAGWVAKITATYAAQNLDKLQALTENERIRLIKGARFEEKESSEVGNVVHDWIDRYVKKEEIPLDEFNAASITARHTWNSFLAFLRLHNPVINRSEFTVWNDTDGYAGTADLDMSIGERRILVDTKTGKNAYWDTSMQLAALAKAEYIINDMGEHEPMPEFTAYGILHLRPTTFKLVPVFFIDEAFQAFLGLKAAFDLKTRYSEVILGMVPDTKSSTVPA